MQEDRSARLAGSVRGLGVCDALRLELDPLQREDLEAALGGQTADWQDDADRAALARIRAGLPPRGAARFAVVGPAALMLALVAAALAAALERVRRDLASSPLTPATTEALTVAAAWIETALDSRAVERYGEDA